MIELPENPLTPTAAMAVLTDIERWSQQAAEQLPASSGASESWDGLAFFVAGVSLVASMNEVSEMLPAQHHITRIPGARPWVLGLANVRGNLLPVIDLQVFLGGKPVVVSKATRVLVVRQRGLECGLLVPAVHGLRHFDKGDRIEGARVKGALGAYVYDAFCVDDEVWPVFNMTALAADPAFRAAAA